MDPLISRPGPADPAEAELEVRKRLRMSGLVADSVEVARLMDADSSSHSDIIPVQFLAGGGLGARSSAAAPDDLSALLDFVRDKVRDMATGILGGRVEIAPYRRGASRACQYCPYGPLCSFDILLDGNQYRVVRTVPEDALWDDVRRHRRTAGASGTASGPDLPSGDEEGGTARG
jgi:ATP-dependent helicase/nuclease subunit B